MRKPTTPEQDQSSEEREFLAAVKDAKRFKPTVVPPGLARRPPPARRRADRDRNAMPDSKSAPPPIEAMVEVGESLSFRRPGVQERAVRRLRRGLIPVQAQIDLHGMTQQAAWDLLQDFLRSSRERGFRCVRVIHGKGMRSGARGPVLKSAVDTWLRRCHDVVAFVSARAIDGGAGALYVLLRA